MVSTLHPRGARRGVGQHATSRAIERLFFYGTSFRFYGPTPIASETKRLQRSYTFNPAQAQQEQESLRDMRHDTGTASSTDSHGRQQR